MVKYIGHRYLSTDFKGGAVLLNILREHKHRGKQIVILAKAEIIKTYKGSLLGPAWAVIKPLFTLFIYWFAFAIGLRVGRTVQGVDFFIFMLPGFVAWFFMNDSILGGSRCIRKNSQYVRKMSFPVSTIMTFSTLANLFIHLVLVALMYIYLVITGYAPSVYNLQFFFYCPLMFIFFLFLSWSTATMSAFSRDFQNLIFSLMTGFFWLSGIIWNSYDIKNRIIRKILLFNPITYCANGYRKAFIYNVWFWQDPSGKFVPEETIIFLIEIVVFAALGVFNYNRLRKKLPDVL